jgi:hypothetical protein
MCVSPHRLHDFCLSIRGWWGCPPGGEANVSACVSLGFGHGSSSCHVRTIHGAPRPRGRQPKLGRSHSRGSRCLYFERRGRTMSAFPRLHEPSQRDSRCHDPYSFGCCQVCHPPSVRLAVPALFDRDPHSLSYGVNHSPSARLQAGGLFGQGKAEAAGEGRRRVRLFGHGHSLGCLPAQVFRGDFALGAFSSLRRLFVCRVAGAAANRRTADTAESRSLAVQSALVSNREVPAASRISTT